MVGLGLGDWMFAFLIIIAVIAVFENYEASSSFQAFGSCLFSGFAVLLFVTFYLLRSKMM